MKYINPKKIIAADILEPYQNSNESWDMQNTVRGQMNANKSLSTTSKKSDVDDTTLIMEKSPTPKQAQQAHQLRKW